MKKIYLSSPFFKPDEVLEVRKAENILKALGHKVFVPMDIKIDKSKMTENEWAKRVFEVDKLGIDKCDVVVLLYWGLYSDSGTAWECGYAFAKQKPVVVVHCQNKEKNNLMMTNGCFTNLPNVESLKKYNFEKLDKTNFFGFTSQT